MMTDPAAPRPGTHLDPDQMADLLEGLLDPGTADAARAHLASCPLCSADFALIAGETDLGALLPPAPIPQDVVARVEAALHREPPLGAAAAPASHATRPRRRRFRIALGSLAGATLVIAGGIGTFVALNNSGGSSAGSTDSAVAGREPSTRLTQGNSHGGAKSDGQSPDVESPQAGGQTTATTPRDFNSLSIEQQAEDLLGRHTSVAASGTAGTVGPGCRPQTVPAGTKPLASAQIQYQGKAAVLVVYPDPGAPSVADVYVLDRDSCTSGNPGHPLDQTTVARP